MLPQDDAPVAEAPDATQAALDRERAQLLERVAGWLDGPMLGLAFVWLGLLVVELVWGTSRNVERVGLAIWGVFVVHFVLEFTLAPRKLPYLRHNWLTALALLVPALRVLRVVRLIRVASLARAARGLRLLRVVSSLNRGMGALGASLQRRGFSYVVALTLIVVVAGAAGMFAFERETPGGLSSYPEALWWTAMIMTTMGSQFWPHTLEGRLLCVALSLYAFGVFGYVTATLATFFVGRDAAATDPDLPATQSLAAVHGELAALRLEIRALAARPGGGEREPRPWQA